jgi:type IV secretory pathway TrbF-like protein
MTAPGLQPTLGRVEAAEERSKHWRHVAYLFIGLFVGAVLYSWWLGAQSKKVLHLTQIDNEGKVLDSGEPGSYTLHDEQIKNIVQEWILWTRWRTDEPYPSPVEGMWHKKALDMTDKDARKQLKREQDQWAQEAQANKANPIRVKLDRFVREKEGPNLYRFWWSEFWTPKYGATTKEQKMSVRVTVEVRSSSGLFGPLLRVGDPGRSPTGVFIVEYAWIRQEES